MKNSLARIRNTGIIAHIDAGKTTVTERILYYTGQTHKLGEVHDGTAVMDFMQEEQDRGITISSAATSFDWLDRTINLIDTPGHVDFTIEVERSLRVLDGAIVVFCGVGGVEPQSETVWRQADRYRVPKIAFVNKMDRVGADLRRVLEEIAERFEIPPLPLQAPVFENDSFVGILDFIREKRLTFDEKERGATVVEQELDSADREIVEAGRSELFEALAMVDETFMERYLEDQPIEQAMVRQSIRRATLALAACPVLLGAALRNQGIQPLLDAVVDYLPSPAEVPPISGLIPDTSEPETRPHDAKAPFAALAFKIASGRETRLTYIRIYSGTIEPGQCVQIIPAGGGEATTERVARIFRMHADRRSRLQAASAGDIVALAGSKTSRTGSTLCASDAPIVLEGIAIPDPVISIALEPKSRADAVKLESALRKLSDDDPTFQVTHDTETGQTIISGMGELHLEVVRHRLVDDYHIQVNTGRPHVVLRETIRQAASSEQVFAREMGSKQAFGHVALEVSPRPRGKGVIYEVSSKVTLPPVFLKAIKRAVHESLASGPTTGYPVIDVAVRVAAARFRERESIEMAYQIAAGQAIRKAIEQGDPVALKPIMAVDIVVPEEFMGEVIGDLNARGGKIENIATRGGARVISAQASLQSLFAYSTRLRSLTQGRGQHSIQFSHFDQAP